MVSHHLAKYVDHRLCCYRDVTGLIFPRDQRVMRVYERKLLNVAYTHLAKFGSHRHCVSGYSMTLVCHVFSQDHVIIWLCDFAWAPSWKVTPLPSLLVIGVMVMKIK